MLDGPGSDVDFSFILTTWSLTSPVAHWLSVLTLILTGVVWLLGYTMDEPPLRKLAALTFGATISLASVQILVALFPWVIQQPISQLWPR